MEFTENESFIPHKEPPQKNNSKYPDKKTNKDQSKNSDSDFDFMSKGYLISITIWSLLFGCMVGFSKVSFWCGVGVTIGCFIVFFFGYWFGVMLDGIDDELEERRKKYK